MGKARISIKQQLDENAARRDEQANIDMARSIAARNDHAAVAEVAGGLLSKKLQSDCIKVLYEIAGEKPALVAEHAEIFFELLESKNNRLVWGAMCALDGIAQLKLELIYAHLDQMLAVVRRGSVITRDHFVGVLVQLAAKKPDVLPLLLDQFANCPPNQLPMYAEKAAALLALIHNAEFVAVLTRRLPELSTESKKKRIGKVVKKLIP